MISRRILSGIQPTGIPHLGNYLGALRPWTSLQTGTDSSFYMIADLHALTAPPKDSLRPATRQAAAALLASGLNPDLSTVFVQSSVPAHAELAWLMGCIAPMAYLSRMTQFKSKQEGPSTLGLFSYPVLMAADIFLYRAHFVPVGDDQKQHIELARRLGRAFNIRFGTAFLLPSALVSQSPRVMSLSNAREKMSKSALSVASRIDLLDNADVISHKLKKAKTDGENGISFDPIRRPEIANLVSIFAGVTMSRNEEIVERFANASTSAFKKELIEAVVSEIVPVGGRMREILEDVGYLEEVLREGRERAMDTAEETMRGVRECVGVSDC